MVSILTRSTVAVLLAAPVVLFAVEAPPLTLAGAVQLAVAQSRLVDAGRLQASSAREMAVAAGQLPDPVLKLGINNLPINGDDRFSLTRDFMTMRSVGVMQEFTREDKRRARTVRFEREADTAQATLALTSVSIRRSTAVAWLDRYYQERMVELLVRQRNEAKLQIEATDAAYRGGRGTQGDVFAARSAAAQIDDRIALSERQVLTAKSQLARWVGVAAEQSLSGLPTVDIAPLQEAHLETQLQRHPQIAVMVKQEEMALADVTLARANKKADWSAEVMFSQRGPAYSNMISITASVPLHWDQKNRQDRELAAKQATALQRRAEREDAVLAHVAEVRAMLQEWQGNRARLKRYDESILPLTLERTQAAIAAYRGGSTTNGSLSAVLEARRTEIDARMERLRLEMDTARLWAQLNYLADLSNPTSAGAQP